MRRDDGYGDDGGQRGFGVSLREQVAGLARVVDSLNSLVDGAPGAAVLELVEEIEVQHRRLAAVRAKVMARAKESGLWAAAGARSFNALKRPGFSSGVDAPWVSFRRVVRIYAGMATAFS